MSTTTGVETSDFYSFEYLLAHDERWILRSGPRAGVCFGRSRSLRPSARRHCLLVQPEQFFDVVDLGDLAVDNADNVSAGDLDRVALWQRARRHLRPGPSPMP
jgi:hypothetical protein